MHKSLMLPFVIDRMSNMLLRMNQLTSSGTVLANKAAHARTMRDVVAQYGASRQLVVLATESISGLSDMPELRLLGAYSEHRWSAHNVKALESLENAVVCTTDEENKNLGDTITILRQLFEDADQSLDVLSSSVAKARADVSIIKDTYSYGRIMSLSSEAYNRFLDTLSQYLTAFLSIDMTLTEKSASELESEADSTTEEISSVTGMFGCNVTYCGIHSVDRDADFTPKLTTISDADLSREALTDLLTKNLDILEKMSTVAWHGDVVVQVLEKLVEQYNDLMASDEEQSRIYAASHRRIVEIIAGAIVHFFNEGMSITNRLVSVSDQFVDSEIKDI
jgi:hypothetical protein